MFHKSLILRATLAWVLVMAPLGAAWAEQAAPAPNPLELYAQIERDRAAEVWLRQQQSMTAVPYPGVVWPPRPLLVPYWMPYPPVYPAPAWGPWCGPSCWPYPVAPLPHPPAHGR